MEGDGADPRRSRRERVLVLMVPVLFSIVAVTQITMATTSTLTSWRGGGFGMFSTLDAHSTRHLRAQVTIADGETLPFDIAASLGSEEMRRPFLTHRAWPRQRTLDRFVHALAEQDLVVRDGIMTYADDDPDAASRSTTAPRIVELQVEVWSPRLVPAEHELRSELISRRSGRP